MPSSVAKRYAPPAGAKGVIATSGTANPMNAIGEGATPLMYACQQSRDLEVKSIIYKKPGAIRERDRTSKTALHYCAENASQTCAEMLLKAAPDLIDARDEDGYTALHLAVIAGNRALIKTLLVKKTDVNSLDNERHSVVHWATVCGEVEALEMVLDAGARASTPDIHGGYPIHYAAQMCGPNSEMGNDVRFGIAVLRKLLARGVDVNVTDRDGRQPILWAASAGSADAILALVNAGANVEADDKDGLTALHCAASRGHTDCLETLVTLCGAEIDVIDSNGCTSLFYAVTLGHADSTQLLLGFGAEPNRQDRKGRTPAHCGAAKGQLETLRILGAHGANLWVRNVKGDYPLHEAVSSGRKDLVRWLLAQRVDSINSPNNDGRCPLHIAAINNNVEMCKIVLDSGSLLNPVMRTTKGQLMTPLDAALHRGNRGCAKYLQLHGGVPASKLTDKAAKLRGGTHRVAMSETHSDVYMTPDLGGPTYSLIAGGVTPMMSVSPVGDLGMLIVDDMGTRMKKPDSRFLQVRLNDDVAIRHVERIGEPVDYRNQRYSGESSDDEIRRRRRRRRRRRERRLEESYDRHSDLAEDERRRRRRRRREEEFSESGNEKRHKSVSQQERRRNNSGEGSDRESDRDTRRKWTGSRQESEASDYTSSDNVIDGDRKKSKRKTGMKQRNTKRKENINSKRRENGDEGEVDEDIGKSRGKSKKSRRKSDEENTGDTGTSSQSSSDEEDVEDQKPVVGKKKRVSKEEISGKDNIKNIKQTVEKTKRQVVKVAGSKKQFDSKSKKIDSDKKINLEAKKKVEKVRKGNTIRDTMIQSEEKSSGKKIVKPVNSVPKGKDGLLNSSPRKIVKGTVKRTSEKIVKSFEVIEDIIEKSDEVIARRVITSENHLQVNPEENEIDKTHRVVTAIVHHEEGSVSETSREVGESGADETQQSIQEGELTVGEQEESETPEKNTDEQTEEATDDTSAQSEKETVPEQRDTEEGREEITTDDREEEDKEDEENEVNIEKTEETENETLNHEYVNANHDTEEHIETTTHDDVVNETIKNEDVEMNESSDEEVNSVKENGKSVSTEQRDKEDNESVEQIAEKKVEEAVNNNDEHDHGTSHSLDGHDGHDGREDRRDDDEENNNKETREDNVNVEAVSEKELIEEEESLITDYDMRTSGSSKTHRRRRKRGSHGSGMVAGRSVSHSTSNEHDEAIELDNYIKNGINDSMRNVEDGEQRASALLLRGEKEVGDEEDSRSRSEASTSRSRNGDSSLLLDSGFEPSPRRDKNTVESKSAGLRNGGANARKPGRISRPCRTDDEGRPSLSTVSVTQAVQNSIRKYHLERSIFQELLELKRLQIRSGRANEQLLVKRLVDEYQKAGLIVGRRQYDGVYTYRNFEKYLYDQLRLLQTSERRLIPRIKSTDDLEKLTKALKSARLTPLIDEIPDNPIFCTHGTHRCHHATHAYTGVPCAAYITKINHHQMPKRDPPSSSKSFLPRIDKRDSEVPRKARYVDPSRPVTLELSHGSEKQVISLPTEKLDKNKRYYVTFTIKGGDKEKREEKSDVDDASKTKDESLRHRHAKSF